MKSLNWVFLRLSKWTVKPNKQKRQLKACPSSVFPEGDSQITISLGAVYLEGHSWKHLSVRSWEARQENWKPKDGEPVTRCHCRYHCGLLRDGLNALELSLINYKLALAIGTCQLLLQGLKHELLWPLTFNTPWKEFGVERRNEALCALGKTGRTGLQIFTYFRETILWAPFMYLLTSRKALKSFMVISAPSD